MQLATCRIETIKINVKAVHESERPLLLLQIEDNTLKINTSPLAHHDDGQYEKHAT